MNIAGVELEPDQAILQVRYEGYWADFCSIKDSNDCEHAELMLKGDHPNWEGEFRIWMRKNNNRYEYYHNKWSILPLV